MMASRQAFRSPVPPDLDIDRYINFDQVTLPSPPFSPTSSQSKSISAPTSVPNTHILPTEPSNQPAFAPPSHQYDGYSNLNGLPAGALLEAYSFNQGNQNNYGRYQSVFGNSMGSSFDMNTNDNFDFGSYGAYNHGDMDLDFGTTPILTQPIESYSTDFIDPSAIGEPESPQVQQPAKRAYPGMHQQQAALAKAQAEEKQKLAEAERRKQGSGPVTRPSGGRPSGSNSRPPIDPVADAKISQLLHQMRHKSVASSNGDDAGTQHGNGNPSHGSKFKKDEEDMDEDERLLASEEGKKLSSKERRQLRNKVSARAFRSRRKEYIGQLEGELDIKKEETDALKARVQALENENAQLLELTRTLLASPAFAEYTGNTNTEAVPAFAEYTGNTSTEAVSSSSGASYKLRIKLESTPQPSQKDVDTHGATSQNTQGEQQDSIYVGRTIIPQHPTDLSTFEANTNAWANTMDFTLYDTPVYAVTSLPEGPMIEQFRPSSYSEKGTESALPLPGDDSKMDVPLIERMPETCEIDKVMDAATSVANGIEFDESDPAFALYADNPSTTAPPIGQLEEPIFGNIELEKAFGRLELVLETESASACDISSATLERFQRLCARVEALSEEISQIIPQC